MSRTAIADGSLPHIQKAASDALLVQDAVNMVAVVGCFHKHLVEMCRGGLGTDDINNHPVSLAFISKLNSLSRLDATREEAALLAIAQLDDGGSVEYPVIPI